MSAQSDDVHNAHVLPLGKGKAFAFEITIAPLFGKNQHCMLANHQARLFILKNSIYFPEIDRQDIVRGRNDTTESGEHREGERERE
jgi:hypothetical protein